MFMDINGITWYYSDNKRDTGCPSSEPEVSL